MNRFATLLMLVSSFLTSSAFAAVVHEDVKESRQNREKNEKLQIESRVVDGKLVAHHERIFQLASFDVDSAAKDQKCDGRCQRAFQSLELIVRDPKAHELISNVKPEAAVLRISKEIKSGISPNEALSDVLKDLDVKEDGMIDCAGK